MADYITPYFPREAKQDMRQWERGKSKPAFARVLQQRGAAETEKARGDKPCKNCGGEGNLYVSYCSAGPSKVPVTGKRASTYFEGGPMWSPGWYLIEKTVGYMCPECSGRGALSNGGLP